MKRETESLVCAAQDQALHTNAIQSKIYKENRKILVLSWLILMGNFTKFGLLKDWCEKSQMFKMWDKSLQDIKIPRM